MRDAPGAHQPLGVPPGPSERHPESCRTMSGLTDVSVITQKVSRLPVGFVGHHSLPASDLHHEEGPFAIRLCLQHRAPQDTPSQRSLQIRQVGI